MLRPQTYKNQLHDQRGLVKDVGNMIDDMVSYYERELYKLSEAIVQKQFYITINKDYIDQNTIDKFTDKIYKYLKKKLE